MVHERRKEAHRWMDHRRKVHRGGGPRRGMLAQLEKTLNVPFVWLVPCVSLVGENVNFGHLTYISS
jgi:hypothetical protein